MLINCPECGNEVSDQADVCLKCGINIQKALKKQEYLNMSSTKKVLLFFVEFINRLLGQGVFGIAIAAIIVLTPISIIMNALGWFGDQISDNKSTLVNSGNDISLIVLFVIGSIVLLIAFGQWQYTRNQKQKEQNKDQEDGSKV